MITVSKDFFGNNIFGKPWNAFDFYLSLSARIFWESDWLLSGWERRGRDFWDFCLWHCVTTSEEKMTGTLFQRRLPKHTKLCLVQSKEFFLDLVFVLSTSTKGKRKVQNILIKHISLLSAPRKIDNRWNFPKKEKIQRGRIPLVQKINFWLVSETVLNKKGSSCPPPHTCKKNNKKIVLGSHQL